MICCIALGLLFYASSENSTRDQPLRLQINSGYTYWTFFFWTEDSQISGMTAATSWWFLQPPLAAAALTSSLQRPSCQQSRKCCAMLCGNVRRRRYETSAQSMWLYPRSLDGMLHGFVGARYEVSYAGFRRHWLVGALCQRIAGFRSILCFKGHVDRNSQYVFNMACQTPLGAG